MQFTTIHRVILIFFVINVLLAFYATPITDLGDAGSYIEFSNKLLGEKISENFAHRSPLFSMILAVFINWFGIPLAYKAIVFFQYGLVFLTALIIFQIFKRFFAKAFPPFLIALLFNLSFSTIYFANILLSEILTVFLLMLSVYFLIKFFNYNKKLYLTYLGISVGLISLVRFNAVPIIFTFFLLLLYFIFIENRSSFKNGMVNLLFFLIPYIMIMNSWALYNFYNNGFYGLFPLGGGNISRNVIVASIRPENEVSPRYQAVLEIFLKANAAMKKNEIPFLRDKYSIRGKYPFLKRPYAGYRIYHTALPDLKKHFALSETDGEYEMGRSLDGFYKEIRKQNQKFIWKVRFYSLLSSFAASTAGHLPAQYRDANLNALPAAVIKLYKICVPVISFFVFISFFIWLAMSCRRKMKIDFCLLTLFLVIFSFWGINFFFAAAANASRYKFPAEPLIIGLFVYCFCEFARCLKYRKIAVL